MTIDLKYRKEFEPDPCEFVLAFFVGSEKVNAVSWEARKTSYECVSAFFVGSEKEKPRIFEKPAKQQQQQRRYCWGWGKNILSLYIGFAEI